MQHQQAVTSISESTPPSARLRRRNRFTLTGDAMHAVAKDLPPMGPGFSKKLLKRAARLEVGGNYEGRAFFTLRDVAGELLGEVDFAPGDFAPVMHRNLPFNR